MASEIDHLGAALDEESSGTGSLEGAVKEFILASVDLYRRRGGLIRALTASIPATTGARRRLRKVNARTVAVLVSRLEQHKEEITHPHPRRAIGIGLLCVYSALIEAVLDPRLLSERYPFSDEVLVPELTRVFLAYVGAET